MIRSILPYSVASLSFGRRLREDEKEEYTKTLNQAYDKLGVKEVAMIIHGSAYPGEDLGVGSPCSKDAAELIKFNALHGFNNNQLGPLGQTMPGEISPYESAIFDYNKYFIDYKALTTKQFNNILSESNFNKYKDNSADANLPYKMADFRHAFRNHDKLIKIAYQNNELNYIFNNDDLGFRKYKKENPDMEERGLFYALAKEYRTHEFKKWNPDANLMQKVAENDTNAIKRLAELKKRYNKEIDIFQFEQFILDKQFQENKELREKMGFKYIGDNLVGNSEVECWLYPQAFMQGIKIGCPDGGKNGPQTWQLPVVNPNRLFLENGELDIAGQLLKRKLDTIFKYCENVRIDHAIGLIDPYLYAEDSVNRDKEGNLDLGRFWGTNLSNQPDLDKNHNYPKILEKIVLPTLKEHGIDKDSPVWEDLGNGTWVFNEVFRKQLDLPGITQLQWSRIENSPQRNWVLIGSHDSVPAQKMIEEDWVKNGEAWNPLYLAGYLNSDPERSEARNAFCDKIAANPLERVKAKFMAMFSDAEKIQISFADFFGIDQTYNYGGKKVPTNWKLRLNDNYEDQYYKNLSSDRPTALNMPEILKGALQAKIDREVVMYNGDRDSFRKTINGKNKFLLDNLQKFADILKEKEPEI